MRAVILAAGVGRRLKDDRPKALLEIGGRTLLSRHLENLAALDVPVRIVTGFMAEELLEHAPGTAHRHNPEFRRGSLLSLSAGLEGLDEDVVVMDADVLYDPTILADVTQLERGFAIDPRTDPGDEEMMIGVKGGIVRAIRRGKLPGFDLVGEGVGFFKLDAASLPALRTSIDAADPEGDYEAALDAFVAEHGAQYVEVAGRPWTEIDFPEDVETAERDILPQL
ncbi:MAG: phosphocholine cytidylyltransferase family protein [Planctomycetota bacterium]|nr:phosphocholine cytidylyltransferase family protein [Planctomycetota bacterium]